MEKINGEIVLKLKGTKPGRITACNENGYAIQTKIKSSGRAGNLSIRLPETAAYLIISR